MSKAAPTQELYFVSGPSRSTYCAKEYVEVLIRIMCLESGDDQSEYTATKVVLQYLR